jgi:hypothetical protein
VWHDLPQPPQFAASDVVSLHVPLHDDCPEGHTHLPDLHVSPPLHVTPHPPQLFTSVVRFVQTPVQKVRPLEHDAWQTPATHMTPVGHACPHAPQFF